MYECCLFHCDVNPHGMSRYVIAQVSWVSVTNVLVWICMKDDMWITNHKEKQVATASRTLAATVSV